MIKAIISDLSRVLLFARDEGYEGKLNDLHEQLMADGDYDFWAYFKLNTELLEFYSSLALPDGVHIFTTRYIQQYEPLQSVLEKTVRSVYISRDLGSKKDDAISYQRLVSELDLAPEEIIYIDDLEKNIAAARAAGLQAVLHEDNQITINHINQLIKEI